MWVPSCAIVSQARECRLANHRGVGAGRWWPLAALRFENALASEMSERIDCAFVACSGDRPWATSNIALLCDYMRAVQTLQLPGVTCHLTVLQTDEGSTDTGLAKILSSSEPLGFDVAYPTGYFSFIESVYAHAPYDLRRFLDENLNSCGLFESREKSDEFMVLYQESLSTGSEFETLDGAIPIALWEDKGATELLRLLGLP